MERLGVDLLTINGSKIYGPKGIGLLYVRDGVNLRPILYGGEQEKKMRPGTENVPAIVGLAEALKIADKDREKESARLVRLRDYFLKRLLGEISKTVLNGHPAQRLPNNVNVSILDAEGESIVLYLDEAGVACSTGSACTSENSGAVSCYYGARQTARLRSRGDEIFAWTKHNKKGCRLCDESFT